ncbi:(Fe-S)-binding protein [Candidatus Poribacteria bacterium]|nr:(Fe-S)-binding protein [Candidatus Poribacteria bacterium]
MSEPVSPALSKRVSLLHAVGIVDEDKLLKCTHCGFCLPTCPTYRELGLEMDSPRGRLYLMRSVLSGRSRLDDDFKTYIYRCLDCRACESACPSGVPYGVLVEQARAMFEQSYTRSTGQRALIAGVFGGLLPHQGRIRALFGALRFYQRSGLQRLVRGSGVLKLLGRMGEMESFLPPIPSASFRKRLTRVTPAEGERRYRIGFISGCIMEPMFADINLATVRVLARNGCEVVTPREQGCCGALHLHNGVRDRAKELAKTNIEVFLGGDLDAIVINSAGCGAALKEYGELFEHDPEWAERAAAFSAKMRDVHEWLVEIGTVPPTHSVRKRVTYDDACHLIHGQKVSLQPRALLKSVPGIEWVELRESDWCCGSAGIYNITQPDMSEQILSRKMKFVEDTQADILLTGNPGCLLQLRKGVRQADLRMHVMHPIELLDWAYTGVEPDSIRRGF